MSRKVLIIIAAAVLGIVLVAWFFSRSSAKGEEVITVQPEVGDFNVTVTTTGELRAKHSTNIMGPMSMRRVQISQLKISDLVPEGTLVKKGEYVAQLDPAELNNKIQEIMINLQKYESEVTRAKLDSALNLSEAREQIINLRYAKEERKLDKEGSIYEPPATRRAAEIEYEKAIRALRQAQKNYDNKVQQAVANVKISEAELQQEEKKLEELRQLLQDLTIIAPENGMVIYYREWDGKKRIVGSMVSTWMPIVATLPDLDIMESITYVNEVDIQKVKAKQEVEISLDALPDVKLRGKVTDVANIGEQLPNSDSKVFEVRIRVVDSDSTLRPAMTTSNEIKIASAQNVISVPLEAVHNEDTVTFVFKKVGLSAIKQEVRLGLLNENRAVIEAGVAPEDELYLSMPENPEELQWAFLRSQGG